MSSPATVAAEPVRSWRKHILFVWAAAVLLFVHILWQVTGQTRVKTLVARLSDPAWEQAKASLVGLGETSMPYVVRAFYYDLDPVVRVHAGQTLLATLDGLRKSAPTSGDAHREWQRVMRTLAESDMVSKALADENAEVRALAGKVMDVIGCEQRVDEGRYRRWKNIESLLAKLRQDPKAHLAAVMQEWRLDEKVGDFGNSVLVGLIAAAESKELRDAATQMLDTMLATSYRADDREEMVKLVGHRRLRLLLRLLADDVPGVERLLSFSPSFSRQNTTLIPGIRAKLKEAKAKGPQELETALTRWKDIYTEVEEGQRTVLRSKAVIEALAAAGK